MLIVFVVLYTCISFPFQGAAIIELLLMYSRSSVYRQTGHEDGTESDTASTF